MCAFQFVLNSKKNFNRFISISAKKYIVALLISGGRKNCTSMSRELGVSFKSIYEFLDPINFQETSLKKYLIAMVNIHATKENPGTLISDGSHLIKLHSKKLKCVGYDFNSAMKLVLRGMSCITIAWTNGKILIPLDFDFWIRKKEMKDETKYKKKTELSLKLIHEYKNKIPFAFAALDGDYGNAYCFNSLEKNNIKFEIRIAKNRIVSINGIEKKLKDHECFKFKKNEKFKTEKGTCKGQEMYFTAHKRNGPNGTKQVVFIASNIEGLTAKEHVLSYDLRWPIEKFFRTSKQYLGVRDCQSTSTQKQRAHIFATFVAFAELENQKIFRKKKNPEQVLKIIRAQNVPKKIDVLPELECLFM